jgi:hypothetical protein
VYLTGMPSWEQIDLKLFPSAICSQIRSSIVSVFNYMPLSGPALGAL